MTWLKSETVARLLNTVLRFMTLAAKLILMLYMGRYLSLADLGVYGLVSGAVLTLSVALGLRFDYVVTRDLVGATPFAVLSKMRDQAAFYFLNHCALGLIIVVLITTGSIDVNSKTLLTILALSVADNCAGMTYSNMNSLGRPMLANMLFFIRAGLWVFPVIGLGLLSATFRTSDVIFICWMAGIVASLVVTICMWNYLPWRDVIKTPIDWAWIKKGVARSAFIWLGSLGLAIGFFVDRFVVGHDLGLDLAGVTTFYASFTAALFTLVQSGVLFFTYPRLITLHRNRKQKDFWREVRKLAWHVALFAGIIAVVMGIGVPLLGRFFHRQLLADAAPTLWLMLFSIWIRCNAETLYYILFSRHQDRAIWMGDLLFLIPAFGGNVILVPLVGFNGIGYSAIIASVFILLWRFWHVKYGAVAPSHEPLPAFMPDAEEP